MAVISEILDESNGGDPNKKSEEPKEENQNKKPEEEVENRNEKSKEEEEEENRNKKPEEEAENPNEKPKEKVENRNENPEEEVTSFESLPIDITEICVARVRRCYYPALSLTSTAFNRLIASPGLYETRWRIRNTECALYALVGFPFYIFPSWFILYRNDPFRLRRISSLPPMPYGSAVVTIGPEIYVIGGSYGYRNIPDVLLIDCRYHTLRSLPRMKVARCRAAAGVIDGKIYVIGGCDMRASDWIEVFDVETQIWLGTEWPMEPRVGIEFVSYTVMEEKIYALDPNFCHAYDPNGEIFESWFNGYPFWQGSSCVIDDLLYSIDPHWFFGYPIIVYDPELEVWKPLKGVNALPPSLYYYESKMANFGGKLVILACNQSPWWNYGGRKEIWCLEIALERRQGGEIWGNLESVNLVFTTDMNSPSIELCRTLTL